MKNAPYYECDGEYYYDPFLDPIEDDEFYYLDRKDGRIHIGHRDEGGPT